MIGLRSSNGVILLPKYICQNVNSLQQATYELLVRQKAGTAPVQRKAPVQKPVSKAPSFVEPESVISAQIPSPQNRRTMEQTSSSINERDLYQIIKFLNMDGYLSEQEGKLLLDQSMAENSDLLNAYYEFSSYSLNSNQ
jgi:hypothetical protein